LGDNCPLLRRVKLSGLTLVTDVGVSAIVENSPLLLELDLHQCENITDLSVRKVWKHSVLIREIRLSMCTNLTDLAFPAVNTVVNPFPSTDTSTLPPLHITRTFEQLRLLDLTFCARITDDAVEGIVAHAPKIRNLVLAKCSQLTDRSANAICGLGKHLHYLHLGHASRITDAAVKVLAKNCTRIRYIDFANCAKLTDAAVAELSVLPKLRRIGLVRVTNLTDEAVYMLGERHASLERIHLSYCDQISVMAVHYLLLKLHKLTHLSLSGVPAFRQPNIQRYCREAPKEFTTAQRQNFCVFSNKGVWQLRTYLTQYFDNLTEQNGTDDTDYEYEDFFAGHQHENTPDHDGEQMAVDDGAALSYHVIGPHADIGRGSRGMRSESVGQLALQPTPDQAQPSSSSSNGGGRRGDMRLFSTSLDQGSLAYETVRGRSAGRFPIQEPMSPQETDVDGLAPNTPSSAWETPPFDGRSGAFARASGSGGNRQPGAAGPTVFAMRRGSPGPSRWRDFPSAYDNPRAAEHHEGPATLRVTSDPGTAGSDRMSVDKDLDNGAGTRFAAEGGASMEGLPSGAEHARRSSQPPIADAHRPARENRHRMTRANDDNEGSARGRGVRRTLRNGLSAAEQYASSLFLGRPWPEDTGPRARSHPSDTAQRSAPSLRNEQPPSSGEGHTLWFGGR